MKRETYLSCGVHIGMKGCTKYMRKFIYKIRDDGFAVFDLKKVDERIGVAAKFLSKYEKIMVVGKKASLRKAVEKFAEVTGSKPVVGRFVPGTITNPSYKGFYEPDVLLVLNPLIDEQAISEAVKKRIPVVALCDTNDNASNVDLLIPGNNNGKKSVALILMLLAREILKNRKMIKDEKEFKHTIEDFGGEK